MKSSLGQHYVRLDHVRGLAAFMVVAWHFTHAWEGTPAPFGTAPLLAPFDEGHTGVALFMTLSGYIFAKLLDGRDVLYLPFLWNRFLRLFPLLFCLLLSLGIGEVMRGGSAVDFAAMVASGLIWPVLPHGGWSITAEMHFYLVLPFLIVLTRRWPFAPLALLAASILLRNALFLAGYDIQFLAYWTIVGRIDQFLLGMFFFQQRHLVTGPVAAAAAGIFLCGYALFDMAGGFYQLPPEAKLLWVYMPAFEGAAYGILIAWYDARPLDRENGLLKLLRKAGEYSYSIYLLHVFYVFTAAAFIHEHVMDISSFYLALPWAAAYFLLMLPIGYLSFTYLEKPFLEFRTRYVAEPGAAPRRRPAWGLIK